MKCKALFLASCFVVSTAAFCEPNEVPAPVEKIFIPYGFDNNDNVEVILQGKFPDTCYQVGRTGYKVDKDKKEIHVWSTAFDYAQDGNICNEVLVPFLQKVSVGILPKGTFKVVLDSPNSVNANLVVSEATTSMPDENLYAPVHSAYLNSEGRGSQEVTLVGSFPMLYKGCMILKEVKVYRNPIDILVILPIAEIVDDGRCAVNKNTEFKINKTIEEPIRGEGLLHVRVSNGSSVNQFFDAH